MDPLISKLVTAEERFLQLESLLSTPEIAMDYEQVQVLSKERASLENMVNMYREYRRLLKEKEDAQAILEEGAEPALTSLAREEIAALEEKLGRLDAELTKAILPRDARDEKDVIVEIREGVGGREAALFAADLYRMYTRYALLQNWDVQLLYTSPSDLGGFKEIVFEVRGKGAFSRLKFEQGAHRVQRVPVTEASGRIHTSTATVAVLPEVDEVDVELKAEDLRIDIYHASGHGGQNVNKVSTAVRIVHIPSGAVAACQDERSQFKNKQKAMAILRARIFETEQRKRESEISQARRAQVGTGERAEKIRTYNVPQDRITDHRVGVTFHGIQGVLDGNIDEVVDSLAAKEQAILLEKALAWPYPLPTQDRYPSEHRLYSPRNPHIPNEEANMAALGEVIRQTQHALEAAGIPDARLEAELLLTNTLRMPRQHIYAYQEQELNAQQTESLARLVDRRLKREPLAYILGHKESYGVDLAVGPGVMVPRPETELLVEQTLFMALMHMDAEELVIAEAGIGSGAISINLAIHLPRARIYATDLYPQALKVGEYNIRAHNVADRVTALLGDLLEPVPESADFIVANLPYIASSEISGLQPEIQWEPREALDGGPDGLDIIRRLLDQAQRKLKPNGVIILEIDPHQVGPLEEQARRIFPNADVTVEQDLAHLDRIFIVDLGRESD